MGKICILILISMCFQYCTFQGKPKEVPKNDSTITLNEKNKSTGQDPSCDKVLPPTLIEFIKNNMEDYSIVDLTFYKEGWEDNISNRELPFYTKSDFNGDGKIDFALLLFKSNVLELFVFHALDGTYLPFSLESFKYKQDKIDLVISVEPKGTWEAIDTSVTIRSDGILLSFFSESQSKAFYWDGYKYSSFLFD